MRQLPNWLTSLRLILIPVLVVLMVDPSPFMMKCAAAVFISAALTDLLDGYIARRYGAVSDFGKLVDPLADKILVMAALVMLVAQRGGIDSQPWVPGYLVVLILSREMWVTGIRAVAASRGQVVAAQGGGKLKNFFQMSGIPFLMLRDLFIPIGDVLIPFDFIGLNFLGLSILLSYWSAVDYTVGIFFSGE